MSDSRFAVQFSVPKLAEKFSPHTHVAWDDVPGPLPVGYVDNAIKEGRFEDECWSYPERDPPGSHWALERHAARIAYLALTGWNQPIVLNTRKDPIDLIDGYHRLAAAMFLGLPTITGEVWGSKGKASGFIARNDNRAKRA